MRRAAASWQVPKFMMANGKLVKTLIYTDVTKYLEFKASRVRFLVTDRQPSQRRRQRPSASPTGTVAGALPKPAPAPAGPAAAV
jgi:hypothetical protein